MRIFHQVADLGSFTRAAEILSLPKATVSLAVQELESALGTRLLNRTTRRVQLTSEGWLYFEQSRDLVHDYDELQNRFQKGNKELEGRIRVDLGLGMTKFALLPRLHEFVAAHPKINLELSSTDRRVDLITEGFDCVVRVGPLNDSGLIARSLGNLPIANAASPAYIKRFGKPKSLDDLARHELIHYTQVLGSKTDGFEYWDGGEYRTIPMKGTITVNNSEAYMGACLAGFGIIQAPAPGLRPHFEAKTLVEVLPDAVAEPMPVSLLYVQKKNLSRRVQVFMDWLASVIRPYVEQ